MIKLGCCLPAPVGAEEQKKLKAVRKAGFDYVEYGLRALTELSERELEQVLSVTRETGLPVRAVNVFLPGTVRVAGPDADLGQARAYLEKAFPIAKAFGVQVIVFGSGGSRGIPEGFSKEKAQEQLAEFLRLVEEFCARFDIVIAIESLRREECNMVNTVLEGLELAKKTDRPHIRLLADYYHMQCMDESVESICEAKDYLVHTHIASREGRRYPLPEKRAEHLPFFAALKAAGYEGGVSIEGESPDFMGEIETSFRLLDELRR